MWETGIIWCCLPLEAPLGEQLSRFGVVGQRGEGACMGCHRLIVEQGHEGSLSGRVADGTREGGLELCVADRVYLLRGL